MGRYDKLFWIAALSASLIVLALLVGEPISASAKIVTTDLSQDAQRASHSVLFRRPETRHTQLDHTFFLPLVLHQEPPKPRLYRLTIDPADLTWLYNNPHTYETVPAVFEYESTRCEVEVRFRGGTARDMPKKSWKIDFPSRTPFEEQRELNLNAEYVDKSLLREALAYDLFERAGLPASRAGFARLEVNGQYMGVFVQVEQVDKRLLDRIGWDPNGNLFKSDYGNLEESSSYDSYQRKYVKKTNKEDDHADIIAFIQMINRTPEADFPAAIAEVMDVGQYLDWVALHVLIGDFEWVEKNYYLYHELNQGWWALMPWDMDLVFGHNWSWEYGLLDPYISWDNPIDSGTEWSKKTDGKWNKLVTEVLRYDDFKFAYCRRLWELMNDEFSVTEMYPRIDAFYNVVAPYAEVDPYKWGNNDDFRDGPNELKTYVSGRLGWLAEKIPAYCPSDGPMPLINELMGDNAATLTDEVGDYEPWIELYNPGLVAFDVGGMSLWVTPTAGSAVQWTIPEGTAIPPGDFVLIWADGEMGEGPLHASFRLDAGVGGTIRLFDKTIHGSSAVDGKDYVPLASDRSLGRFPDGGMAWIVFSAATPGWSNQGRAPFISATMHTPAEPDGGQPVTVSAVVTDEIATSTATLYWFADGVPQSSPMTPAGGDHYSAVIPGLSSGTVVTYYMRAEDAVGLVRTDPPRAPDVAHGYIVGFQRPSLYINELVAVNRNTLDDEAGESDDWFEIYNAGLTAVNLGGMYLTDAIQNTTKWQIPAGVSIPAGGHVVFWADEEIGEGITHTNFQLDGDGERLALYAGDDNFNGLIDEVYYGPQTVDQPWGRYPDGAADWRVLLPTPGQANQQLPPAISELRHQPAAPLAGQAVTVTAIIQDDGGVVSATLYYNAGLGFQPVPFQYLDDDRYNATIPAQASGVDVAYYAQARDDLGAVTTYPQNAPAVTYGYQVGYSPPPLFINEFLASNDTINQDEWGEYEDWVELYNAGDTPLDVGGMYLTDDLSRPTRWRIPNGTTIPAKGFLLIWTDDDGTDGPLHTNFKLSKDGEEIGLFDRDGAANALIDSVVFGPQVTDVSSGRSSDGGATWTTFTSPTPGESN